MKLVRAARQYLNSCYVFLCDGPIYIKWNIHAVNYMKGINVINYNCINNYCCLFFIFKEDHEFEISNGRSYTLRLGRSDQSTPRFSHMWFTNVQMFRRPSSLSAVGITHFTFSSHPSVCVRFKPLQDPYGDLFGQSGRQRAGVTNT